MPGGACVNAAWLKYKSSAGWFVRRSVMLPLRVTAVEGKLYVLR